MSCSWKLCLVGVLTFCLPFTSGAQDSARNSALSSALDGNKLLLASPWLVHDGELLCVVTEKIGKRGENKAVIHVLTIYRQQGSKLIKIFDTEKIEGIVNVSPLAQYDGDLLVGWVHDGAYRLEVYVYSDGTVQRTLDTSSGGMPEILYAGDGRPIILITNEVLVEGRGWIRGDNSTADVYRRNGKTYEKIAQIPWPRRFQNLPITGGALGK